MYPAFILLAHKGGVSMNNECVIDGWIMINISRDGYILGLITKHFD